MEISSQAVREIICLVQSATQFNWLLSNPFCIPSSKSTSGFATICGRSILISSKSWTIKSIALDVILQACLLLNSCSSFPRVVTTFSQISISKPISLHWIRARDLGCSLWTHHSRLMEVLKILASNNPLKWLKLGVKY